LSPRINYRIGGAPAPDGEKGGRSRQATPGGKGASRRDRQNAQRRRRDRGSGKRPAKAQGEARAANRTPEQQLLTVAPARRKTRRGSGAGRASRRDESGDVRRLRRCATPRVSVRGARASRPKPPATGTPRSARRHAFIRRPAEAPSRRPKLSLLSRYSDRRRAEGTAPVPRAGARPKHSRREQRDAAQRRPPSPSGRPFRAILTGVVE